ncbi:MAG: FliM/FliN family flagellar motor switch protein [Bryobacteraceae bacterium]|nr:FliM/FliN family flagellar motor switch protein [Bryobacteraceae bacterium]
MTSLEQIAHYSEVPVEIGVELDRRVLSVRKLLDLEVGGILELNRSAGENIDILVGNQLVAFGEIVITEDAMGVRITDFIQEE